MKVKLMNRKMYEKIRRFDHNQMQSFTQDVYKSGFEDGQAAVPGVDLVQIEEAIRSTKGIGERKLQDIMANINNLFQEGEKI